MIRVLGEQFFIMIVDLNDYRLLTIFLASLVIMLGASEIGRLIFASAARDIAAARSSRRLVAAVTYSEIIRSASTFTTVLPAANFIMRGQMTRYDPAASIAKLSQ
jgi:hypothetical protein